MSLKTTDVRTPGAAAIAKKWNIPLTKVYALISQGAKVEFEHNRDLEKAKQVARDHINERPDYYKRLKHMERLPISMKEESGVGSVRGLGYVSGDPAGTNFVQQYIDTNAMAYDDVNGSKLGYQKKYHSKMHKDTLGFNEFDPTKIKTSSNKVLKEFSGVGIPGGAEGIDNLRTMRKNDQLEEGPLKDKAKKVAMAGMTAANLYTAGDVMSRAAEGRGGTKGDVVRMASALPGAAGWGATGVHYAKKAYDYVKSRKTMKEDKDPCWKGYQQVGMKKKGGKKVPNCVPVKEQGPVMSRYSERPTYEQRDERPSQMSDSTERGIYETSTGKKLKYAVKSFLQMRRIGTDLGQDATKDKTYQKREKGMKMVTKEGHIGFGTWGKMGDGFQYSRKNTYGTKPKEKPESNEPGTGDTYKGSKQGGTKVNKVKPVREDWQSVNRKDKTDGLSQKAVNAYKRENPGSKLQTAVTEKNPSGKRAARRKSFCSRMGGMKKRLTSAKTARDPDSRINKALRRWNCEEETQINELKAETLGSYIKKASASRKDALNKGGAKADVATWGKRQKGITTAIKKLTREDANRPDKDLEARSYTGATGLTHTIHEETKMDTKAIINEAIDNIVNEDLNTMKDKFTEALNEKVMEKLEEKKKAIAANYFAQ